MRITADPLTKLRKDASKNSVALYNVEYGTEHQVLEQTKDKDGTVWYKIKFHHENGWRTGWVRGDYVEVFYKEQ